jgi:UPF0755 protein
MKKIFLFIFIAVVSVAGLFVWWKNMVQPVSNDTQTVDFLIPKGSSASAVAQNLAGKGLVKSSLAFRVYVQVKGLSKKIIAGEYTLSPSYSIFKTVEILMKGPDELWVTIPEGLRREQIAVKFATSLLKKDQNLFVEEFLTASKGREGYLFPDTYLFPKTATAQAVVATMLSTFEKRTGFLVDDPNIKDTLVTASIIERETLGNDEKPVVAGILIKRQKAGWPLQADATIQYAVATVRCEGNYFKCKWWETVSGADLEIKSVYNTYKLSGLPPAPICNPGLASIKAADAPEASDFWFYLHDGSGQIHYAASIEEHNANVKKYLK